MGGGRARPGRPRRAGRVVSHPRRSPDELWWTKLPDEDLLDVRISSLGLSVDGTTLAPRVARLEAELDRAGLAFRPYVWLSTDWFTPDRHTGFAVPLFLAHPRLARLERRHMFEVEGGTEEWCMKLLRHETAHALDNAYGIHRRRRWRQVFGPFSRPYRETYVPRPVSEHYVLNLDYWYAQSHPSEDFAETFSVWLQPSSRWRSRYQGWPALAKLEYVDDLMAGIARKKPQVRTRARPESLSRLHHTLRTYYRRKQALYSDDHSFEYDEPLQRVFSSDPAYARRESGGRFLWRMRRELREGVAAVTGQHQYLIGQVLNEMVLRCRRLGLHVARSERETLVEVAALVAALTMSFLGGGHPEYQR